MTKEFVTVDTGKNKYTFPNKYDVGSVSSRICAMLGDGYTAWDISKITGVRYQMVRNVGINGGVWESRTRRQKKATKAA